MFDALESKFKNTDQVLSKLNVIAKILSARITLLGNNVQIAMV